MSVIVGVIVGIIVIGLVIEILKGIFKLLKYVLGIGLVIGVIIGAIKLCMSYTTIFIVLVILVLAWIATSKSRSNRNRARVTETITRMGAGRAYEIAEAANVSESFTSNMLEELYANGQVQRIPLRDGVLYKSNRITGAETNFVQHTIEL